jgi:general secretion pathway protein N
MSVRRLLVIGTLVFVAGLVLLFPARVAYRWATPPGLNLSGIAGTVWRGSAAEASVNGIYLRDIHWKFVLRRLFQVQAAYALDAAVPGGYVDAEIGVSPGGDVHVRNFRGSLSLASLGPVVGLPGLEGNVNADISRLRVKDGAPVSADGFLEVGSLVVPAVMQSPLGSFRADLETREDGIAASVVDTQAVFDLTGRALLTEGRNYEFLGSVAPTADTPDKLEQQMRILGTPDANGQRQLRLAGRY